MTSNAAEEKRGPSYVYKLVPPSIPIPDPLPEKLEVSDLDASSGFIHLSTSIQVPGTLKHFFGDQTRMFILRVPLAPIEKLIRWEDPKGVCGPRGGEGLFPHLYNGLKLGKDEVERVRVLENDSGGWDTALKEAEDWLVY